jgi:prophage regulatory protein
MADNHQTDRILRFPEVKARVGLCRSHIHNLVAQGKFPAPIKLGARASGWLESEIDQFIQSRIEESRKEVA